MSKIFCVSATAFEKKKKKIVHLQHQEIRHKMDQKWLELVHAFDTRVRQVKNRETMADKKRRKHDQRHKKNQKLRRQQQEIDDTDPFDIMYERLSQQVCSRSLVLLLSAVVGLSFMFV